MCFAWQWLWLLPTREQLWVCGAGGAEGPSAGVLFKRDHRAAADQRVRIPAWYVAYRSWVMIWRISKQAKFDSGANQMVRNGEHLATRSRLTSCVLPSLCSVFHSISFVLPFTSFNLYLHLSYRKIPGDQCEGGFQPDRKETDVRRMCTSDALHPNSLVSPALPGKESENRSLLVNCTRGGLRNQQV